MTRWFAHYQLTHDTVELNAPFYHWPLRTTVQRWARDAVPGFKYTIKVNRMITHLKRFNKTKEMVREFSGMADVLGDLMGCFLFQLPPSFRFTTARLRGIVSQLDPRLRNAVEFRHSTWSCEEVFRAFEDAGLIFCSVSAPNLPDDLIRTADAIYVRFHGVKQWYRYDYSDAELAPWVKKIRASRAKEVWAYFNNDFGGVRVPECADAETDAGLSRTGQGPGATGKVAQICNLLYRRIAFCSASVRPKRPRASGVLPSATRRYGRL
jgi:uncharacterized protein YecE (DUF72 family)